MMAFCKRVFRPSIRDYMEASDVFEYRLYQSTKCGTGCGMVAGCVYIGCQPHVDPFVVGTLAPFVGATTGAFYYVLWPFWLLPVVTASVGTTAGYVKHQIHKRFQ